MKSENEEHRIVPGQTQGQQSGAMAEKTAETIEEAKSVFENARLRLMNVGKWEKYGGQASFTLVNALGEQVNRLARKGDYIRINLPGPGPRAGDGYDWVMIEEMLQEEKPEKDEESFAFRVRPSDNPQADSKDRAHFFTGEATSSFIVERKHKKVIAKEVGRNEKPNKDAEKLVDKVRNTVVAVAASHGLAHFQWKSLMDGILSEVK